MLHELRNSKSSSLWFNRTDNLLKGFPIEVFITRRAFVMKKICGEIKFCYQKIMKSSICSLSILFPLNCYLKFKSAMSNEAFFHLAPLKSHHIISTIYQHPVDRARSPTPLTSVATTSQASCLHHIAHCARCSTADDHFSHSSSLPPYDQMFWSEKLFLLNLTLHLWTYIRFVSPHFNCSRVRVLFGRACNYS